ncbi:uncharacterized protein LOC130700175 [Daphnia carinata]|uniref:uncharacterized protein LOC130700175 n=1 Tax=Daphnia carinata TaxID=120202 RepID=UPI00257CB4A7|nr:uncharacterized protein LOC130700175 [Daphnia carinata]
MSLLNLKKSKGIIACLVILQLSMTRAHPVRSSGTIQRVARNDPERGYQQFGDQTEVEPTGTSFSEDAVMEQETSPTESSFIQEEINPFISSGPESFEIVTPSFLDNQNGPVLVSDVEPVEKLEDPSANPEIAVDPFIPFEGQWPPAAPSDSNDVPAIPTDLPIAIHSLFLPISEEVEPIQKVEEPSFDPLVVFSSEVEPIQKLEDLPFDPTAVPVSNEPELIHNDETPSSEPLNIIAPVVHEDVPISNEVPFSEPLDVIAPVLHEDTPNQSVVDPSIDSSLISEDHSVDVPSSDAPISNEAHSIQNLEDPSVNPVEVVPVEDEPEVDTKIVAEPVTNIVANHPTQEEPQSPPAASSEIDVPPQAVFISTVFPPSPITVAPVKAQDPVSPYSVTSPKKPVASYSVNHPPSVEPQVPVMANMNVPAKTQLKSYPAGQQLKQQSPKQSPVYGKIKAQSNPISSAYPNAQAQINQPKYQVTSPTPASGPPRATLATSYGNNRFPTRPFGSSPKPRQLGFPPVSNTRDNVLLQVNWAANVGRPYRST